MNARNYESRKKKIHKAEEIKQDRINGLKNNDSIIENLNEIQYETNSNEIMILDIELELSQGSQNKNSQNKNAKIKKMHNILDTTKNNKLTDKNEQSQEQSDAILTNMRSLRKKSPKNYKAYNDSRIKQANNNLQKPLQGQKLDQQVQQFQLQPLSQNSQSDTLNEETQKIQLCESTSNQKPRSPQTPTKQNIRYINLSQLIENRQKEKFAEDSNILNTESLIGQKENDMLNFDQILQKQITYFENDYIPPQPKHKFENEKEQSQEKVISIKEEKQTIENKQPQAKVTTKQTIENEYPKVKVASHKKTKQKIANKQPQAKVTPHKGAKSAIENELPQTKVTSHKKTKQKIANKQPQAKVTPHKEAKQKIENELPQAKETPHQETKQTIDPFQIIRNTQEPQINHGQLFSVDQNLNRQSIKQSSVEQIDVNKNPSSIHTTIVQVQTATVIPLLKNSIGSGSKKEMNIQDKGQIETKIPQSLNQAQIYMEIPQIINGQDKTQVEYDTSIQQQQNISMNNNCNNINFDQKQEMAKQSQALIIPVNKEISEQAQKLNQKLIFLKQGIENTIIISSDEEDNTKYNAKNINIKTQMQRRQSESSSDSWVNKYILQDNIDGNIQKSKTNSQKQLSELNKQTIQQESQIKSVSPPAQTQNIDQNASSINTIYLSNCDSPEKSKSHQIIQPTNPSLQKDQITTIRPFSLCGDSSNENQIINPIDENKQEPLIQQSFSNQVPSLDQQVKHSINDDKMKEVNKQTIINSELQEDVKNSLTAKVFLVQNHNKKTVKIDANSSDSEYKKEIDLKQNQQPPKEKIEKIKTIVSQRLLKINVPTVLNQIQHQTNKRKTLNVIKKLDKSNNKMAKQAICSKTTLEEEYSELFNNNNTKQLKNASIQQKNCPLKNKQMQMNRLIKGQQQNETTQKEKEKEKEETQQSKLLEQQQELDAQNVLTMENSKKQVNPSQQVSSYNYKIKKKVKQITAKEIKGNNDNEQIKGIKENKNKSKILCSLKKKYEIDSGSDSEFSIVE